MADMLGSYSVIYKERGGYGQTSYVCRHPGASGKRFLLVVLSGIASLRYLIPYTDEYKISDFVEAFSIGGAYCMVFVYLPGRPLGDFGRKEGARLAAALMETMVRKGLPNEYAAAVLEWDRILADGRGGINFVYAPPVVTVPVTQEDVFEKAAAVLERLWPEPPDEDGRLWLEKLRGGGWANLCEAYSHMPKPAAAGAVEVKHGQRFTRLIESLPPVVASVLTLTALLTAAWLYFTAPREEPPQGDIRAIGDIVLYEE